MGLFLIGKVSVTMELAVSLNVFDIDMDKLEQGVRRSAAAGFACLDFNFCDYYRVLQGMTWEREKAWVTRIRDAADAAGVRFVQAHGPMFRGKLDDTFVDMCERSLRSAAIAGVRWVVVHPINLPSVVYDRSHRSLLLRQNVDFMNRVLPTAEHVGVGIAVENMMDHRTKEGAYRKVYGSTPEELAELVDAVNHPLAGVCWDTGHALIQGLDQRSALSAIGHRLKATHIQDNDGLTSSHYLPYHGIIDWDAIMHALRDIRYKGAFTFETHRAIRNLPDELRDSALKHAALLGNYLLSKIGENKS
jgi:sugar phosphate isomerase/epimerase